MTTGTDDPQSIALDPAGKFAYVANAGCNSSVLLRLDVRDQPYHRGPSVRRTTGVLIRRWCRLRNCRSPGKFAYVTNWGDWESSDGSVLTYTINPTTGALTFTGAIDGNNPAFCRFNSVVVDPSGRFAYAANGGGGSSSVSMYTINATTGALTSIGTITTGGDPVSVAVDPSGKFAYVDRFQSRIDVSMYTINATTGALTSIGTITTGRSPVSVAVDPIWQVCLCNQFKLERRVDVHHQRHDRGFDVYRDDCRGNRPCLRGRGSIWQLRLCGQFQLERRLDVHHQRHHRSPYAHRNDCCRASPSSIAVHASGKFAYVTNSASNDVSMYSIDTATGVLTLIGTIGT